MTSSFYVNDDVLTFLGREHLESTVHMIILPNLVSRCMCWELKCKIEDQSYALPPRLLDTYDSPELPANILFINNGENLVTDKSKYLGCLIAPALIEDLKIHERDKKATDVSPKTFLHGQKYWQTSETLGLHSRSSPYAPMGM